VIDSWELMVIPWSWGLCMTVILPAVAGETAERSKVEISNIRSLWGAKSTRRRVISLPSSPVRVTSAYVEIFKPLTRWRVLEKSWSWINNGATTGMGAICIADPIDCGLGRSAFQPTGRSGRAVFPCGRSEVTAPREDNVKAITTRIAIHLLREERFRLTLTMTSGTRGVGVQRR
jgi:hypothetical protein